MGGKEHVSERFVRLLALYRKPDGSEWGGQDLENATGGAVTRSYVSNLKKGRIGSPGLDKLEAIARAMGFPPELWFDDVGLRAPVQTVQGSSIAERVEHLFGAVRNPGTGAPYTAAEVARMTAGDLTEGDVEGIRTGEVPDPTVRQVTALAGAFGMLPSYLIDRGEPPLDEGLVGALRDETVREITHESATLPERERRLLLGIARQLGEARGQTEGGR